MSPKKEAEELIEMFIPFAHGLGRAQSQKSAIQCAIIAVGEIIKILSYEHETGSISYEPSSITSYKEVLTRLKAMQ